MIVEKKVKELEKIEIENTKQDKINKFSKIIKESKPSRRIRGKIVYGDNALIFK